MPEIRSDSNETSASDIVEILKKYRQPIPIDFVATKLKYNPNLVRAKMKDLEEEQIVAITDNDVTLKRG